MILQNSADIKTEYFTDRNGDIIPVDVQYEKHIINPNGLVQLRNLPSPTHTVFTITRKDGFNVINYNKVEVLANQYDFTVDYINGILTFQSSQRGKEIQVSYTNSIGRLSISAERIFTGIDNQGGVVNTLQSILDDGREILSGLNTLGGAKTVIEQTQANVDSIKGLTGSIIEGSNIKTQLDNSNSSAKITNNTLNSTITNASGKISEMNSWVQSHGDIVNLDNRVNTAESKLNTASTQLEQKINYKKYFLSDNGVIGDNTFKRILDVFPYLSLSGVQSLDNDATLNNSAHWYVLQKLINDAEPYSKVIIDGEYVVDMPITIRRNDITIEGLNNYRTQWTIKQIGENKSLFRVRANFVKIKNLLLTGIYTSYRTKHGIEIFGDDNVFNQVSNMSVDNCYIQNFGGCGIYCGNTHFILSKFKDTTIYNCHDHGILLEHNSVKQMNGIIFENFNTYHNGLEYVDGSYQLIQNPTTAIGHGMSISGTGITIIGGDSSENASCGVFIHDGYWSEGVTIQGRYFENNKLCNLYSEARKPLSLSGNYMYSVNSLIKGIYYKYPERNISSSEDEILNTVRYINKPIGSYIHSDNKEVIIDGIDKSTNEFISQAHGLVNGDVLYPILNKNIVVDYAVNIYPSGIFIQNEGGFKVVNATTDRFKISTTNDGLPINLSNETDTFDLSKWHFEVNPSSNINVANLLVPKPKKIKARIRGRILANNAPTYIIPIGTSLNNSWLNTGGTKFDYPLNQITGDIFVDLLVQFDCSNNVELKITGKAFATSRDQDETIRSFDINKTHIYLTNLDGTDGLSFRQFYIANGTSIDIYLDE